MKLPPNGIHGCCRRKGKPVLVVERRREDKRRGLQVFLRPSRVRSDPRSASCFSSAFPAASLVQPKAFIHSRYGSSLTRDDDVDEIVVPVGGVERLGFLLEDVVADLPEGGGARGPVDVVVLVEPVAQHAAAGPEPADLHALGPPPLFAVEDGKRRPPDCAARGLAHRACWQVRGVRFVGSEKVVLGGEG